MNFATKLIVAVITISATIVGSIWTGFETLDGRMDDKVKEGKKEVMTYIQGMKSARDAEIHGINLQFYAEISGVKTQLASMDSKLNLLIGMGKRQQVLVDKEQESLYTNMETTKKEEESL